LPSEVSASVSGRRRFGGIGTNRFVMCMCAYGKSVACEGSNRVKREIQTMNEMEDRNYIDGK